MIGLPPRAWTCQPCRRANIRLIFQLRLTRFNSPLTASGPHNTGRRFDDTKHRFGCLLTQRVQLLALCVFSRCAILRSRHELFLTGKIHESFADCQ